MNRWRRFLESDKSIFAICVLLAASIWLVNKLSQVQEHEIHVKISYELPPQYIFSEPPLTELRARVSSTGWHFWRLERQPSIQIRFPVASTSSMQMISETGIQPLVLSQLDDIGSFRYLSASPTRFAIQIEKQHTRCIPLVLPTKLSFAPNYNLSAPISFTPDSVCLGGSKNILKSYNKFVLDTLSLSQLQENQSGFLPIHVDNQYLLQSNIDKVNYQLSVSEYTTVKKSVAVEIHSSSQDSISIFPRRVQIQMDVPLDKYNEVKDLAIPFYVHIEPEAQHGNTVAVQQANNLPFWIKHVRIQPQVVEYYIVTASTDSLSSE